MKKFLSETVADVFKHKLTKEKLFGIEVEAEFDNPPPVLKNNTAWKVTNDGSLRGYALEFVSKPLLLDSALVEINYLYDQLKPVKILDSMRAGVHVHINCRSLTLKQLFTFIAAYYVLEKLLTEDLGEERQGNLFCLRLEDAEYANANILACLQNQNLDNNIFLNDNFRYSALNLVSLSKFGTLEFRALRTPLTPEPIIDWIETLNNLFEGAKKYESPEKLLSAMSADGADEVVKTLLKEKAKKQISKEGFEDSIYSGIREIQHWVYLTDWEGK
jgi:hypothetical protein